MTMMGSPTLSQSTSGEMTSQGGQNRVMECHGHRQGIDQMGAIGWTQGLPLGILGIRSMMIHDGFTKSARNSGHQDVAPELYSLQDFVGESHPTFLCRDLYQTSKTCKASAGKLEFS